MATSAYKTKGKCGEATTKIKQILWHDGTRSTLTTPSKPLRKSRPRIESVSVTEIELRVELSDAREISVPVGGLGCMAAAPLSALRRFRIATDGVAVQWPEFGYAVSLGQMMGVE